MQCQCRIQIPAEIRKIKWWKWRFGTVSDPITLIKSANQNLAWEHWPIRGWGWGSVSAAVSWTLEHCSWHPGLVWFSSEESQHQSHNFHCQGLRSNLHTQTDAADSTAARGSEWWSAVFIVFLSPLTTDRSLCLFWIRSADDVSDEPFVNQVSLLLTVRNPGGYYIWFNRPLSHHIFQFVKNISVCSQLNCDV